MTKCSRCRLAQGIAVLCVSWMLTTTPDVADAPAEPTPAAQSPALPGPGAGAAVPADPSSAKRQRRPRLCIGAGGLGGLG